MKTLRQASVEINIDLEDILESAERLAQEGDVPGAKGYLIMFEEYIEKTGDVEVPTERLVKIEKTSYEMGVERFLENAQTCAGKDQPASAKGCLEQAQRYASKIGIDITDRVKEITKSINNSINYLKKRNEIARA